MKDKLKIYEEKINIIYKKISEGFTMSSSFFDELESNSNNKEKNRPGKSNSICDELRENNQTKLVGSDDDRVTFRGEYESVSKKELNKYIGGGAGMVLTGVFIALIVFSSDFRFTSNETTFIWGFFIIPVSALTGYFVFFRLHNLEKEQKKEGEAISEANKRKEIYDKLVKNELKVSKELKFEGSIVSGVGKPTFYQVHLILDYDSRKMVFCKMKEQKEKGKNDIFIIAFDDVIKCELLEDNTTIMEGGVGRAFVGGALAGEAGAIVGATTRESSDVSNSLKLRIITSDVENHLIVLDFINNQIKRSSHLYKSTFETAQEMYSLIISVTSKKEQSDKKEQINKSEISNNFKQKLRELKELLDEDIITKEEYDIKRGELLNKF